MFGDFRIWYLHVVGELFWFHIYSLWLYLECRCLWWKLRLDRSLKSHWLIFFKLWVKGFHFYHMGWCLGRFVWLFIMCYWYHGLCCTFFTAFLHLYRGVTLIRNQVFFGMRLVWIMLKWLILEIFSWDDSLINKLNKSFRWYKLENAFKFIWVMDTHILMHV